MSAATITASDLRPADILVSTGRALISGAIRLSTGTDFSHTILYIGDNTAIEAISDGVVERDLSLPVSEATLIIALRRRFMTNEAKANVIQNAKDFRGLPYDYLGAAAAGLTHKRGVALGAALSPLATLALIYEAKQNASEQNRDKKFFCSELVARCFELAGMPISDYEPSFTTPRTVRVSPYLMYVGHLVGGP